MIIKHPTSPKIKLSNLLRRRKATLLQWTTESGIQTYEQLARRCESMGIIPPEKCEFDSISPKNVTVATEGIVVIDIEPMKMISEKTGEEIASHVDDEQPQEEFETLNRSKRYRKRNVEV